MAEHEDLLSQGPREAPEPLTAEERTSRNGRRAIGGGVLGGGAAAAKLGAIAGLGKVFIWFFAWDGIVDAGSHLRLARRRGRRRRDRHLSRAAPSEGCVMDARPRYMISVAAELVGMHPQTLRIYEQKGLVRPQRTAGNTRLYSDADVERLQLIQRLTTELGLNLAGVERVLHLEDELQRMRRRLDRMEAEMRQALDEVHRSYRRDLVLYRPTEPQPPARRS